MAFLKFIYYSIGIWFVIYELLWMLDPYAKSVEALKINADSLKYKHLKWDDKPKEHREDLKGKLYILIFFLWLAFGIMTSQWALFIAYLVTSVIIFAPIRRLFKNNAFMYAIISWFSSLLGFVFGVFVILNAYHLRIDVNSLIIGLFK